jgi:hypothetical protein
MMSLTYTGPLLPLVPALGFARIKAMEPDANPPCGRSCASWHDPRRPAPVTFRRIRHSNPTYLKIAPSSRLAPGIALANAPAVQRRNRTLFASNARHKAIVEARQDYADVYNGGWPNYLDIGSRCAIRRLSFS